MSDKAHQMTDKIIRQTEKRLAKEYSQAARDVAKRSACSREKVARLKESACQRHA